MASIYKIVGSSSGSGGGGSFAKYTSSFNSSTDWGTALSGYYTILILEATHNKGITPSVEVYEASGGSYENVQVFISYDTSGNISIKVTETPDCRFTGKVVIF